MYRTPSYLKDDDAKLEASILTSTIGTGLGLTGPCLRVTNFVSRVIDYILGLRITSMSVSAGEASHLMAEHKVDFKPERIKRKDSSDRARCDFYSRFNCRNSADSSGDWKERCR